jgi:hypothetical protein
MAAFMARMILRRRGRRKGTRHAPAVDRSRRLRRRTGMRRWQRRWHWIQGTHTGLTTATMPSTIGPLAAALAIDTSERIRHHFLAKPFTVDQLHQTLSSLLSTVVE